MNCIHLIGNLTRDPEKTTTANGRSVCKFSLAVSRAYANAEGERETDFFNIVAWRALADNCAKYLIKGKKAAVTGELQTRSYEQDGVKRYVTEILANSVEFLSPHEQTDGFAQPVAQKPRRAMKDRGFAFDEDEDDLPF